MLLLSLLKFNIIVKSKQQQHRDAVNRQQKKKQK